MPLENSSAEPKLTEVIAGIVSDFQTLMSQQFALLRAEMTHTWQRATGAVMPIAIGGLMAITGFVMFGVTLALLLYWTLSPPGSDLGRLPLWGCFALTSFGFMAIGGGLVAAGAKALRDVSAVPRASAEEMEKNVAALVNPHQPQGHATMT